MKALPIIIIICITAVPCLATDYYLDGTSGNNINDGLTLGTAWKTFRMANDNLNAGDTLYVRAGTYDNGYDPGSSIINPRNSGTPGNYITYMPYNNEAVTLRFIPTENGILIFLRGKRYIKIDGFSSGRCKYFVDMRADAGGTALHNIVQNCTFDGSHCEGSGWYGICLGSSDKDNLGTCEYNQVLNNYISGPCAPADLIYFIFGNTRYNLIQGNTLEYGSHNCIEMQSAGYGEIKYNIIRQNTITNPWHTGVNIYWDSDWTLLEDNIIYDCGNDYANNYCGTEEDKSRPRWNHPGIQLGSDNVIIRRNKLYNNGSMMWVSGQSYAATTDCRIYNNTFYKNYFDIYAASSGLDCDGTIAKNNIFCDSVQWAVYHNVDTYYPNDNYIFHNQISYQDKGIRWEGVAGAYDVSAAFMEANAESLWKGNIIANPLFVNASTYDFQLMPSSPCIDAGDWLTTVQSAPGTGRTFVVEDASYFCDGWDMIPADMIQLEGQTQAVKITGIDYANNTITVDTPITWQTGQGVSHSFSGFAPDMGAFECIKPLYVKMESDKITGTVPLTVSLRANALGDNPPFSYRWSLGNDIFSTEQNPTYTFSLPGEYEVKLTVLDSSGLLASTLIKISVIPPTHTLSVQVETDSRVNYSGGTTNPAPGVYSIPTNESFSIRALPDLNFRLGRWSGSIDPTDEYENDIQIFMNTSKSITAVFNTQCGDVNGDLMVSPIDAQTAFDIYLGRYANPSLAQLENADVNCDGDESNPRVTPADAHAIFEYYLGRKPLPTDCSGKNRSPSTTTSNMNLFVSKGEINYSFFLRATEEIIIPIEIDIDNMRSFGFDFFFPQHLLDFKEILTSDLFDSLAEFDAYEISRGVIRIGGFRKLNKLDISSESVTIHLIFVAKTDHATGVRIRIQNLVDDLYEHNMRIWSSTLKLVRKIGVISIV